MAKAKPVIGIDCDAPVQTGMKLVLSSRFEEMCAFRKAVLDWNETAGVHDMRVASRRLRGALQDFAPYLEKRRVASSVKQIKHIASSLGEVRDLDVAIITLKKTAANAPAEVARGIGQLVEARASARDDLRLKILPVLEHESLRLLSEEFAAALNAQVDSGKSPRKGTPATNITYREVAKSIILERLDKFEQLSTSLYHPLKKKPLHKMRIAAKHLRYALELFEQCWGPQVTWFAKKVSGLQSSLGKLHDCDVWIEDLGDAVTCEQKPAEFDYKTTVIWLLTHFVKARTKHVSQALAQWQEWETNDFSAQLRDALH